MKKKIIISIIFLVCGILLHIFLNIDKKLFLYINSLHCKALDTILLPLTYWGDGVSLVLFSLILGYLSGWQKFLRAIFILILVGVFVHIIKSFFPSVRPVSVLSSVHILGRALKAGSFPSGHTASSVALGNLVSKECSKLKVFVWFIVILIAYSRIYCGVHFVGDVVFGFGLGLFVSSLFLGRKTSNKG